LAEPGPPILEVRGLSKSFGGLRALADVDVAVPEARVVGLVGPNGSGKTTFLNVVTGFLGATNGSVLFRGEEIGGMRPEAIARNGLTRTFQEATVFPECSVRDNVIAGMLPQSRLTWRGSLLLSPGHRREKRRLHERADEVLDRVGFKARRTVLAGDLGLGEQKHLGIALALASEPSMLMLDEPAAGMGDVEVESLLTLLGDLRRSGLTVVLVEHNMDLVMAVCDEVAVLDFGVKIAQGTPAAIRSDERVVAAYLGKKGQARAHG
jgi:branched-chain amino acid transport system ATP-binding protein